MNQAINKSISLRVTSIETSWTDVQKGQVK